MLIQLIQEHSRLKSAESLFLPGLKPLGFQAPVRFFMNLKMANLIRLFDKPPDLSGWWHNAFKGVVQRFAIFKRRKL
jgi:hypothetical protein